MNSDKKYNFNTFKVPLNKEFSDNIYHNNILLMHTNIIN